MTGCRHNAKNTLVKNYLYLAEQAGAEVHPLTTVTRVRPREGGGYAIDVALDQGQAVAARARRRASPPTRSCSPRPRSAPRSCCTGCKAEGDLPRALRPARAPVPHQLRVDPRRDRARHAASTTAEGVAITSSFHPDEHTHIEPVRYGKGSNAMSPAADRAHRRRRSDAAVATWLREMWRQKAQRPRALRLAALVGADGDRAGHADARQLDHDVPRSSPLAGVADDVAAGPRRAQPDLDPGRQRGRPPDGRRSSAGSRAARSASRSTADDRALHRRLHDRRLAGDRGRRRLPAGLRPPRPARRRRLGDLGQPRRQPVADDHRPGRAGDVLLAQQGRGRPAPGARVGVPAVAPVAPRSPVVPDAAPGALRLPIVGVS